MITNQWTIPIWWEKSRLPPKFQGLYNNEKKSGKFFEYSFMVTISRKVYFPSKKAGSQKKALKPNPKNNEMVTLIKFGRWMTKKINKKGKNIKETALWESNSKAREIPDKTMLTSFLWWTKS